MRFPVFEVYEPEIPDIDFGNLSVLPKEEEDNALLSLPDALIACVNRIGRVDMDELCRLSGKTEGDVAAILGGHAIFQDPEAFLTAERWNLHDGWVLRTQYLSGNIREKLSRAEEMNRKFPGCFSDCAEALKRCLPASVPFGEISVSLGASWIPPMVYSAFIRDLLKMPDPAPAVWYVPELGMWRIEIDKRLTGAYRRSVLNNYTYGTDRMSAIAIIRETLNARSVKVYDENSNGSWHGEKNERVLNRSETMRAQEKQRLITEAFERWTASDPSVRALIEDSYSPFSGYFFPSFDGSFLALEDMNPEVCLFPHQRNAVARILLSGRNVLLAHGVGTGKTYIMAAAAHELYRTGLSRKNLIAVPNSVLKATGDAHRHLFPDDRILVVSPADFTPAKREHVLEAIRDGDYVAAYMAYSSFDMIDMSKDYWLRKKTDEIDKLRAAAANAARREDRDSLTARADQLSKKLSEFDREVRDPAWLTFDALGIETLFVDEAHNYKNIPMSTRADHVVGMTARGSKKCREMLEKVHSVKRCVFATGTPLTNSIGDLFVLQSYLQSDTLAFHGIDSFDAWAGTFAGWETVMEVDVDSRSIRPMPRITSFHNLPELMSLFSAVCDYHEKEAGDGLPSYDGPENVVCHQSPAQEAYIRCLGDRVQAVRSGGCCREEDNLLKITSDGRKCALDLRLITLSPEERSKIHFSPDEFRKSKIAICADNVSALYRSHPGTLQIVFSDIGTPKDGFNVYDCLRQELVERGVKEREIAFIHDADSESARARLFGAMNRGEVRVVIGSTAKLGTGVNVQEKLLAVHHLSIPWKPSELIQREGRIIRRGNTCPQAYVFRYVTEGTFDSYLYQLLENKARFIASFLSGISVSRTETDLNDIVLSYAEIKALAVGNPLLRKRLETANRLERTRMNSRQRQSELERLKEIIELTPQKIEELREESHRIRTDFKYYTSGRRKMNAEQREAFGRRVIDALKDGAMREEETGAGRWQGFEILIPAGMKPDKPYVWICSRRGTRYFLDMADVKARGVAQKIDYLLDHLPERARETRDRIREYEKRKLEAVNDYEVGNPFPTTAERLMKELETIDRQLAGA